MTEVAAKTDRRFTVITRSGRRAVTMVRETKGNVFLKVGDETICFSKITRCARGTTRHDFHSMTYVER